MALVAQDWPKDMDNRQQRPSNASPVHNDRDAHQQASNPYPQPTYGYPQSWNMNMSINGHQPQPAYFPQMQFYPQHFPHQQQPAFAQQPMYDPNAQFAQWAYQHMMFSAQQGQLPIGQMPSPSPLPNQQQQQQQQPPSLRGRSASHSSSDYYQQQQVPAPFNPTVNNRYPGNSATAPSSHSTSQSSQPSPSTNYQGFHPYRRPERGERTDRQRSHDANINNAPFQPPYARQDAAGSTTSVNSTNSSTRSRTNSANSNNNGTQGGVNTRSGGASGRGSKHQTSTSISSHASSGASSHTHQQHIRGPSTSSSTHSSSVRSVSNPSGSTSNSSTSGTATRVQRPSPLSQGSTFSAAERRKSRDDSDIAAMLSAQGSMTLGLEPSSPATQAAARSNNGLKGRLRRALSFSTVQTLKEEDEDEAAGKVSRRKDKEKSTDNSSIPGGVVDDVDDDTSTAPKKPKKSLRLFNSRFNASTDNISLSSTVSSASVMIRKLGNMGRIARRNSLAGITSLFKDKDKNKDKDSDGKKLKGKAETSVSHVTAELDRTSDFSGPGMEGLTPAAKLARQHTLKSNAEAAARAKALQEAQAAAAATTSASASSSSSTTPNGPPTWEKNTITNRNGSNGVIANAVRDEGVRVVVEEDDSDDDEPIGIGRRETQHHNHHHRGHQHQQHQHHVNGDDSGSDEDNSTWRGHGDGDDDEDLTIRIGIEKTSLADGGNGDGLGINEGDDDEISEPWAMNIRRSVERNRRPAKGILKNAGTYSQDTVLEGPNLPFARVRANSYDSVPNQSSEAGPLARIPSPDPHHIDGLHKHGTHHHHSSSSSSSTTVNDSGPLLLPPLNFDDDKLALDSPQSPVSPPTIPEKDRSSTSAGGGSVFNHPNFNSSEPVLSTMTSTSTSQPTLTHRSATSPCKRLAFAANLSIYNTFSASVYDRRSEPATWSRLTPALAQRIKEELNSYKMEEMEVHAASRIHTQFFV